MLGSEAESRPVRRGATLAAAGVRARPGRAETERNGCAAEAEFRFLAYISSARTEATCHSAQGWLCSTWAWGPLLWPRSGECGERCPPIERVSPPSSPAGARAPGPAAPSTAGLRTRCVTRSSASSWASSRTRPSSGRSPRFAIAPSGSGPPTRRPSRACSGWEPSPRRPARTADEVLGGLLAARRRALAPDDPLLAETLIKRSRAARAVRNLPAAKSCLVEARRILEYRGSPSLLAQLECAERSLIFTTDLAGAIGHLERALELQRREGSGPSFAEAHTLTWLGWDLDRFGRPEAARPYLLEARAQLEALGLRKNSLYATVQHLLADQLAFEGRWDEAEPLFRTVAAITSTVRAGCPVGLAKRASPLDGFDALAFVAVRRGEPEEAWRLREWGRGPLHLEFASLGLWKERDPATFTEARELRKEILELEHELARARRAGATVWEAVTSSSELRVLSLRARLARLQTAYLGKHGPPEPSLETTRAMLGPRTAIIGTLEVFLGGEPSFAWQPRRSWGYIYVLRRDGPIHWIPLWDAGPPLGERIPRSEWGGVFVRLGRAASWPDRIDNDPVMLEQLRAWTRRLFDPALPYLDGVDRLVIDSTRLPIELFRDPQDRFLLDRFTISYVPSATLLRVLAERSRPRKLALRSVLSISPSSGDVEGAARHTLHQDAGDVGRALRSWFVRDETILDALPPLPFAGMEAAIVASYFDGATVLGGGRGAGYELRRRAVAGSLRGFDVIHLAGHTLTDGAPERCGLALDRAGLPRSRIRREGPLGARLHGVRKHPCDRVGADGTLLGRARDEAPAARPGLDRYSFRPGTRPPTRRW